MVKLVAFGTVFVCRNVCTTPIDPVDVGAVVTPDGRVGVSADARVGNVVIGGVSSRP